MSAADPVPRATSLSDIYHPEDVPAQAPRWKALTAAFEARYGHAPTFVSRAPGRVNIIGEHIDYSLYPVLPMAISADAILAVSYTTPAEDSSSTRTTFKIEIANLLGEKFPPATFDVPIEGDVEIDAADHHWGNYFKCGLSGALELLRRKAGGKGGVRPADMRAMMDGSVPVGGGLSSSAAFTTASALAVMFANGVTEVDKTELTELAIVSERGVGVNSGGMDQSASVFSTKHSALLVDFVPSLTVTPISFPATSPALTFLIAQSFVTSEKKITAPIHYNLRVAECSLAAAYLNAASNPSGTALPADNSPLGISLRSFATAHLASSDSSSSPLDSLIKTVEDTLTKEEGYTREEIASVLGLSVPDLEARYMSKFPVRADRFRLRQRALHVFSEARRVESFMRLLSDTSSATSSAADALAGTPPDTSALNAALGDLLNETQASCKDMYECSCPEIDTICDVARRAGSYGSRLTGAGWGGSTVHLVAADKVEDVKAALRREYYDGIGVTGSKLDEALVVSKPGSGTCLAVMSDFQS